jgi:hypothetical protein
MGLSRDEPLQAELRDIHICQKCAPGRAMVPAPYGRFGCCRDTVPKASGCWWRGAPTRSLAVPYCRRCAERIPGRHCWSCLSARRGVWSSAARHGTDVASLPRREKVPCAKPVQGIIWLPHGEHHPCGAGYEGGFPLSVETPLLRKRVLRSRPWHFKLCSAHLAGGERGRGA